MRKNTKKYKPEKQIVVLLLVLIFALFQTFLLNNNNIDISNDVINVASYNIGDIPEYSGVPYVVLNNNIPNFEEKDFNKKSFESYSELDMLGRCGVAFANLSKETMPAEGEKRQSIYHIKPTGWKQNQYSKDLVEGESLYNRCHLIAYKLSAENDNEKNLITGTRYFNTKGMEELELKVMNYLYKYPNNHVLYRVTPIFEGNNLVASGVTMEAESVEDRGKEICFFVYVYNVQPGIEINYATGENKLAK